MEHEHVEDVAFDPLAGVKEVAQGADGRIDQLEGAEGPLQGVAGAHLVGHGQMPQMRAVMSGTCWKPRPRRKAS